MKPIEILSSLPEWANASPDAIMSSPAWAMPCRLGAKHCIMRLDAVRPAETLDLAVRFENEDHLLGIAPSQAFPEISAVWNSRADVPEPVLLALVEKDCGELLQLLENAVRRQLKIVGIANSGESGQRTLAAQISPSDESEPIVFTLDVSPGITEVLGQLRNIDVTHPSVRTARIPSETEYATFALSAAEISSLASGDVLLLPEVGTIPPRIVAAGKFAISSATAGTTPWNDEGLLRVCAAESSTIELGALFDADAEPAPAIPPPQENAPLKLVRQGETVASGRFGSLSGQRAFLVG